MDKESVRTNIEHFRRLLSEAPDETTRQMLANLLAEEEEKLVSLMSAPKETKP